MLYTNLQHIENAVMHEQIIHQNAYVVVIYGRMDPESVSAFRMVEHIKDAYQHVQFYDMELDHPDLDSLSGPKDFKNSSASVHLLFYAQGKIVKKASDLKSVGQLKQELNTIFSEATHKQIITL